MDRERRLGWRVALAATWMVGGAWIDAWSHHKTELESFFTLAHAVLYSGFLATAFVILLASIRRSNGGLALRPPEGYQLALVGIPLFLVGGIGDAGWHTVFGIEQDLDALLSPTHLLLGFGSALLAGGPVVAAWQRAGRRELRARDQRIDLPALISLGLVVSVGTFFTSFANPFSLPLAAGAGLPTLSNFGVEGDTEATASSLVEQAFGVASILVVVAVLMPAVLGASLRWRVPPGGLGLVFALGLGASAVPHEIVVFVPTAVAAGVAADGLVALMRPSIDRPWALAVFAFLVPAALWALYFATIQIAAGLAWPVALWSGSIVLAGAVGVGLAALVVVAAGSRWRSRAAVA